MKIMFLLRHQIIHNVGAVKGHQIGIKLYPMGKKLLSAEIRLPVVVIKLNFILVFLLFCYATI